MVRADICTGALGGSGFFLAAAEPGRDAPLDAGGGRLLGAPGEQGAVDGGDDHVPGGEDG